MARKTNNTNATTAAPNRNRRTADQIVADLQAKIQSVQRREAAKAVRAAPEIKPLMLAAKALDNAIEAAAANPELRRALEAARALLGEQLDRMGLAPPRRRKGAA